MQPTPSQATPSGRPNEWSTDGFTPQRRVVIPVEDKNGLDSRVFSRFGHAPFFAVLDVDAQGQLQGGVVENPCGAEHKPGVVPRFIRSLDADVVLAQKIGKTAYRALQKRVTFQRAAGQTVLESALLWFEGKSLALEPEEGHQGEVGCGAEQGGPEHGCHHHSQEGSARRSGCGGHGEGQGCGCRDKGESSGHGGGCGGHHGEARTHESGGGCGRHASVETSGEEHACRCQHHQH